MAAGGEQGCSLASAGAAVSAQAAMEGVAGGAGSVKAGAARSAPAGQPLYLLRAMLEAAGDPDGELLRQAEDGLPVGMDPLPRTPHVVAAGKRSMGGLACVGSQLRLGRRAPGVR